MGITLILLSILSLYFLPWLGVIHAAYYKGVDVPSAGAVGLFGTPLLGFLYIIAMPADPVKLKRRRLRSAKATDKECPHCLSLIPKQATVCHLCGRNSALAVAKPTSRPKKPSPPASPVKPNEGEPPPIPTGSFEYSEHAGTDTWALEAHKQRVQDANNKSHEKEFQG